MFKQQEQIKEVEKTIAKLKESLMRNKNSDKSILDAIRAKLKHSEQELIKLNQNVNKMQKEKNNLKEKNKLF
jgi:predicted nuclease with TOPRIM domain